MRSVALSIQNNLLESFPAVRSYSVQDFSSESMPPEVAHFLTKTLSRRLEFEMERLRSDWFDFGDPSVRKAKTNLAQVLAATARIPHQEWKSTLLSAVRMVFSHLVRPAQALTGFAFGNDHKEIPVNILLRRMAYFKAYPFLLEIVMQHLHRKKVQVVERDTFLDLVSVADRMMVVDNSSNDWLLHFEPLFKMVTRFSEHKTGIPVNLLRLHFSDKGHDRIQANLFQVSQKENVSDISRELLADILSASNRSKSTASPSILPHYQAEPSNPEPGNERLSESTPPKLENPGHQGASPESIQHRAEQITLSVSARPQTPGTPVESTPSHTGDGFSDGGTVVTRAGEKKVGPIPAPPALPDFVAKSVDKKPEGLATLESALLGRISPEKRTYFVQTLFGGNFDAYFSVLKKLNFATNWQEATSIITEDIFIPYKTDIYSDEAVSFTDAVEAVFKSTGLH